MEKVNGFVVYIAHAPKSGFDIVNNNSEVLFYKELLEKELTVRRGIEGLTITGIVLELPNDIANLNNKEDFIIKEIQKQDDYLEIIILDIIPCLELQHFWEEKLLLLINNSIWKNEILDGFVFDDDLQTFIKKILSQTKDDDSDPLDIETIDAFTYNDHCYHTWESYLYSLLGIKSEDLC